ncbi:type IV pilus assembly protein PilM [Thiohalorhabdus methylotrophus]|uniref:Type IV pilus assembly protein PilM n=1 Tax=Thiohalorhabdus methylotrophus TaxID=3242694 RepID=A0ABV4TPP7_9GAMM
MPKLYNKPLFGLDLSTTSVKAVEMDRRGRTYRLQGYAIEPLPAGAVNDHAVVDSEAVAAAITRARKGAKARQKYVAASVAGAAVITKKISIPAGLDEVGQQSQVEMEADHHLPAGIESMYLDYQVLGPDPADEANQLEVLLVACKRDVVDGHVAAIEAAGLKASVIDVDPFAVESAFELGAPDEYMGKTVALLNIGAQVTNINVLHKAQSIFTRDHYFGGQQLVESLAESYGWEDSQAEQRLARGELPEDYPQRVQGPFLQNLALEIGRSMDFYASNQPDHPVDWVVVSGGCALLPGLTEALEEQLDVQVSIANPFPKMKVGGGVKQNSLDKVAPRLMVATGLALRSFDP